MEALRQETAAAVEQTKAEIHRLWDTKDELAGAAEAALEDAQAARDEAAKLRKELGLALVLLERERRLSEARGDRISRLCDGNAALEGERRRFRAELIKVLEEEGFGGAAARGLLEMVDQRVARAAQETEVAA